MPWQTATPPLNSKRNNFDVTRLLLALTVMLAHVRELSDSAELRPYLSLFDSRFAIEGFFAISGFLVFRSWQGSSGLLDYAERRFRRIYPAYAAVVFLGLMIGLIVTTRSLGDFLSSGETFRYIGANFSLANFLGHDLPGVFEDHRHTAINGSLWTIKVEVGLYLMLPIIALFFRWIGPISAAFLVYGASLLWSAFFIHLWPYAGGETLALQSPGFASFFVVGMALASSPLAFNRMGWIALIAGALWLLADRLFYEFAFLIRPLGLSAIVIFLSIKAVRSIPIGKVGDMSYGVYLLHFPLIQLFIHFGLFQMNPWAGLGITVLVVLVMAWLSWKLVEKPFLRRNSHYIRAEAT